ncbi:MAG: hypothetical protein GX851_05140, partial [Clostridiales bacterium]|nr:hypothetical protein [Clostridiales bacterium]
YKEIDLKRVEVRRKLKRGEITLDELSLPVFSEEEASVQGGEVNV